MAQTKVTGREVSDKSIFFADIDLTTAAMHPALVASDRFLIVDPVDGEIKTSTLTNFYTVLNTNYLQLSGGTVSGGLTVSGTTTLNAVTKVGTGMITNLNADFLDGLHASSFAPANHNHPDTMVYPEEGIALSTGRAWDKSITNYSDNWNEAYGWGNHAGLYSLLGHGHSYEPIIIAGTTSQYWRGDKTWRTLPATTQVLYMSGTNIVGSAGFQYKAASGDFCAGTSAQAVGGNTISLGTSSVAYGDGAVAIGYGASCMGLHSVAIGTYTETSGDYSVMIGLEASCQGDNAVAIGKNAIAYNNGDITLGSTMAANKTSIFGAINFPSITADGILQITSGEVSVISAALGTVTSVALSLPPMFTVTGSPVTTTGTLTATLASQTKNFVLVAPQFSNGVPTFRKLAADDMPDLSAMYDNYYCWNVKINSGTNYQMLKSGATVFAGAYNGLNLVAGTGITLTESSIYGGALGVTIHSTASFSGSQNTLLGRNATGYGVYSEQNPAAIRRIQTEDGTYDNLQYFGGAAAFTRRDLWVSTGALNVNYTGQSLADVTGLSILLGSYTTYEFEAILSVQTSAVTTGTQYAIAYTGSFSQYSGQIIGSINTSYARSYMLPSNTASGTFLTTSGQTGQILIKGIIKTTAGGYLSIKHLKVTSGTSTVLPYSYFKVTEI